MNRIFEETRRFPLSPSYCVSESGRIGRIGTDKWLRPAPLKRGGYLAVSLWEAGRGHTWPVHQVVAITFHGERPSPHHEVAHGDGNRQHNHWSNLRWATRSENEHDKRLHGTNNAGGRNGRAKLSNHQVAEILLLGASGLPQHEIGRRYGVHQATISNILNGKRRAS